MPAKIQTFDDYLTALSTEKRAALENLRKIVKTVAPDAEEYIGYGIAAFRLNGVPLVGLGASANHCSLYMMNGFTIATHADLLKNYDTSKGAIRFTVEKPLPATLVRKLVKLRIAENAERTSKAK